MLVYLLAVKTSHSGTSLTALHPAFIKVVASTHLRLFPSKHMHIMGCRKTSFRTSPERGAGCNKKPVYCSDLSEMYK